MRRHVDTTLAYGQVLKNLVMTVGSLTIIGLLLVLGAEKPRPAAWIIDLVTLLFLFFLGRYLWRLYDRRKQRKQEAGPSR